MRHIVTQDKNQHEPNTNRAVMIKVTDDLKQTLQYRTEPKRIVSLTPSSTETICTLGARERLVGVTKYCVHPQDIRASVMVVGGTKAIDINLIKSLQPDLIVANAEENTTEIFEQIHALKVPLYVAFPKSVDGAIDDLLRMGNLLGAPDKAMAIAKQINTQRSPDNSETFKYAYLIWNKPYMAVNQDTFINHMLSEIGGINVFGKSPDRYPKITKDMLIEGKPNLVLLSSEPFPFKEKHRHKIASEIGMALEQIQFIDGEMCSWHGVRMVQAFNYLRSWKQSFLSKADGME